MKTARAIIAISADANAAILANCDYYAVGDLFDILPELEKVPADSRLTRCAPPSPASIFCFRHADASFFPHGGICPCPFRTYFTELDTAYIRHPG